MRIALAVGLAACTGCGDNEPACGRTVVMSQLRNIWGGQIAVDDERVYYSDYDNGAGTHLIFRQPREGGQELVIGARGRNRFGYGMASDGERLYWTGESDLLGYTLQATPVLGGRSQELATLSTCTAHGVAVDAVAAYAGAIRCGGEPSRVLAAPHDGSMVREIWSSPDADVSSIAALDGTAWLATSAGLVRVSATAAELVDGSAIYHVEIDGDDIVYSTQEEILAVPLAGGAPRTLYTFATPITQLRVFASDAGDLYVSEPPELVFVPRGGTPVVLVQDMGAAITELVARDGAAYWPTLAAPGTLGLLGTFSGAVMRVPKPCL
jgi:hypothetical protein